MKKKIILVLAAAMLFWGAEADGVKACNTELEKTVEVLVVYNNDQSPDDMEEVLEDYCIEQKDVVERIPALYTVCIRVSADEEEAIVQKILTDSRVSCIQRNEKIVAEYKNELKKHGDAGSLKNYNNQINRRKKYYPEKKEIVITEDFYSLQWGIENVGQTLYQEGVAGVDANVNDAWTITTGNSRILVGVLDSGIDMNNVDLQGNIYVNSREIAGNGLDDDRNGYIDDISGWDFYNDDSTVFDSDLEDSHGTYVASILGAPLDGVGMVGVCPEVTIVPLKFMSSVEGGDTLDAIRAIEYAKKIGVKIINCSWTGSSYNPALLTAMNRSGILFVCASGNEGINIDTTPMYPACFNLDNIITVGAIDNCGNMAAFSNYGKKSVDVLAPGDAILGQYPGNMYYVTSGTSAAAPIVAGEAALIYSVNPRWNSGEIKRCIMKNVIKDVRYSEVKSGGRIDVYNAVAHAGGRNVKNKHFR